MTADRIIRLRIVVSGTVQGVGFRPFVHRLASCLQLSGWVRNSAAGVGLEVEGARRQVQTFLARLEEGAGPAMSAMPLTTREIPAVGEQGFSIVDSDLCGRPELTVAPDLAACGDCVAELFDPKDRRYHYPWLSCARCGPRFSMVTGLPYDRVNTSMARFPPCAQCRAEYEDPEDRRFHAEATACPACGPSVSLWSADGEPMADGMEALNRASRIIREGSILAVKGIGGFHLWADALSEEAVRRLRDRKRRPHKPFAVLFPSIEAVRDCCLVSDEEAKRLQSPASPIVILHRTREASLSRGIAPGNATVGALLPYAPLHHVLMAQLQRPVVATSGNLSEEPIVTDEHEALRRLATVADVFLVHDRPIVRPLDDSVVRMAESGPIIIRRARGMVPRPVRLPEGVARHGQGPVLAVGGHLKNTVALLDRDQVWLSQYVGDLSTWETDRAVRQAIDDLQWLHQSRPCAVACDLHPDYRSTRLAEELAGRLAVPLIRVQHHHAHVAACMAEHHLDGEVLGVAWDGAGYGPDHSIWGGEFLRATYLAARRVGHLHPFRLPGGEQAMREPWRASMAVRWETSGALAGGPVSGAGSIDAEQERLVGAMLETGLHAPITTSMGRLFDALASMLGLCHLASFEGQAAMAVEQEARRASSSGLGEGEAYPIPLNQMEKTGCRWVADWRPMIESIAEELRNGVAPPRIAYRFHRALAELIGRMAERIALPHVVLTGGCFQNALLLDLAVARLASAGFTVLAHRETPPNDGSLSLGQAMIAAAQLGTTGGSVPS